MKPASFFLLGSTLGALVACGGPPAANNDSGAPSDSAADSSSPSDAPDARDGSAALDARDAGSTTDAVATTDVRTDVPTALDVPDALDVVDVTAPTDVVEASTCPPPPAALPAGPLTRNPSNPMLHNGPESYDAAKTGPRVVLVMAPGDYRVWYEAVANDMLTTVAYATSSDGITWNKQGVVMSPVSGWEGNEVSPNSILVENGVFRLWYHAGGSTQQHRNIGYAESADGMTWTRRPDPVLTVGAAGSFDDDETAEPRVFNLGNSYRMYYTGHNESTRNNALGMAESTDGITWTKYATSPIIDVARWGNFWGGAFFHEGAVWHLWHGVVTGGGSGSQLEYMWSTDGIQWNDGPSNPVLTTNPDSNAPDALLVGDSVSGYRDGSEYRIMYTGFNWNLFGSQGRFEGVCLAWATADPRCP